MPKLIDQIELPRGLRELSIAALNQVAEELRDELIDTVSTSGGHFASSLGATELTVALHHSFDTPHDRLVWDVGHQAYIHKMLTGRRSQMHSIRKKDGISGFLRRSESEFDNFGAGHAGTSISAAVGMCAGLQRNHPERHVVAIIGDGSMTAGMALEALNNAGTLGLKNLIVVLNDNDMSISPNVGAMSWLFSKAVTSKASTYARSSFKSLYKKGYVPSIVYKAIDRAEEMTQGFFSTPAMLFESFGFRYIGPIDGHNIQELVTALSNAKQQDVPVLIHCRTKKGKGYEPAEVDPIKWHGVNPFDRIKGEFTSAPAPIKAPPSYTSVFADCMVEMARTDKRIVGITAAMASGTGLDKLAREVPESFFDVGICEQHAVTFAAGLACEGYLPVCAIYSTFLQRGFDQVVHDVCIQNLPVIFAMDRAGAVGNDGETHQGAFDISFLRSLPNMTVMSPKDENELRLMLLAASELKAPCAIRYPRGTGSGCLIDTEAVPPPIGKGEITRVGKDVLIIAFGPIIANAHNAAEKLQKEFGISTTVINARYAKPLDRELLTQEIPKYALVCTLEDHAIQGGFGSAVLELVNDEGVSCQSYIHRFGIQDNYIPHASQAEQHALNKYDSQSIVNFCVNSFQLKKAALA